MMQPMLYRVKAKFRKILKLNKPPFTFLGGKRFLTRRLAIPNANMRMNPVIRMVHLNLLSNAECQWGAGNFDLTKQDMTI